MTGEVTINLGTQKTAERLFSYPNLGHETESLQATISHYLTDSMAREGLANAVVSVDLSDTACALRISGLSDDDAAQVQARYQAFFNVGLTGLQDMDAFEATGKAEPDWEFLLPLGISFAYARAVEVMDFPPVTLIQKQDYLNSKTTARWWELLGLNAVATADLARFSCILDIVPLAAPASDGTKLDASGIYEGPFDSYGAPQLELLSRTNQVGTRRPLIALGMPIRKWIQRIWGTSLNILDVSALKLPVGGSCPVIASNHPSFFYYAVHSNTGPGSKEKNLAAGLAVMKQDIVAAAWHAQMGRNPSGDPAAVLETCKIAWQDKDAELLELVKKQAGIAELLAVELTDQAVADVRALQPSREQLLELERRFYDARNRGLLGDDR
jgi:hypothetical protein